MHFYLKGIHLVVFHSQTDQIIQLYQERQELKMAGSARYEEYFPGQKFNSDQSILHCYIVLVKYQNEDISVPRLGRGKLDQGFSQIHE